MRHGFTTMEEIRENMAHMLDAETMMHLTGYKDWTYRTTVARELVEEVKDSPTWYCKETILWAFDYACGGTWEFDVAALNILIDAWMNDENDEEEE